MLLDVLVPDLLLPAEAPADLRELRLPRLEKWLARGRVERAAPALAHEWLAWRHSVPQPVPVAAITLAVDTQAAAGEWLRADPVHLRVEDRDLVLHDPAVLDIEPRESEQLVAVLREFFAQDGLEFSAPHPARWYVRVPAGELPATTPLHEALGRNIFGLLPSGGGRINWRSAITEVQMLFAAHAVNEAREAGRRPAINSVWFWGGGAAPASLARPYALVHADEPFALGLAHLAGAATMPVPASFAGIDAVPAGESVLLVLDAASAPWRRGDAEEWKSAAQRLDEAWFGELGRALERFEAVRLVLPSARGTRVATIDRGSPWRWLRSRKPLNADA